MDLQSLKINRGDKPSARRRRANPWPLRLALLAVVGSALWLFWPLLAGFADRMRLPEVRTFVVAEAAPAAAAAVRGTAANGYLVAARRAALSSDVPGRIVELSVREGSVVKKGDIVARLYAEEYRAALQRAEADVAAADAGVLRSEAAEKTSAAELAQAEAAKVTAEAEHAEGKTNLAWAESELRRVEELLHSGIGSGRDLERAQIDRDAAVARLTTLMAGEAAAAMATATAQQRLLVAGADLAVTRSQRDVALAARNLAQATLDKTDVRAPFDGIVVLKDAEVGEVVSPNVQGGGNARGAVCTMVDFDSLEVQANVPETTLSSVQIGAPADVFLDAFPDDRYEGTVDRIWPTADRQKATVEVRVRLARRDERMRPEMGVRIVFRSAPQDGGAEGQPGVSNATSARTIVVPQQALVEVAGRTGAFVVERDTVRFVPVGVGERRGTSVAIDSGLSPRQVLVLDPPPSLQSGDRVRIAAQ